jgi:hypothetical protein
MAEDPRALMRQQASGRALAADEGSRLQQALERVGIVLLPGSAAFKELMATLKTYSDETGQTFPSVLADRQQMNDIFQGKPGAPTEGSAVRERDVLSDELAKAREKVTRVVKYSEAEQSPRLGRYADEVRRSERAADLNSQERRLGLRAGTSRFYGPTADEAMAAFQRNVDPEFLDKLSFVHWTNNPIGLTRGVRGIPVTTDALSASIYLGGDPGGVGFSGNRWDEGDLGFLLDGDVTWMGNHDAMSGRGEISGRHTTSLDPILDEDTYLTQQARSSLNPDMKEIYDRLGEAEASGMRGTPHEVFGMSDEVAWEPETGNINEALIEKPRVRGIVVDPKGHRLRQVKGVVTPARRLRPGHVAQSLGQAMIAAEEMGVPLYGPDGAVLYIPPNMPREEVTRVSRNFPTTENIQSITPEEFASGGRWAAHPKRGGVFRGDVRNSVVGRLTDEIRLHEVPGYTATYDPRETLHGGSHPRSRTAPLTSTEELEDAVQHFRARPDFRVETDIVDANYNKVLPKKLRAQELEPRLSASNDPGPVSSTRPDEFQRVQDQIQEAEERLAQAPPGSPESREVASKLAKAKAALAKLGYLAGVAGTAYEGGRLVGEIGRHGLREGTQRYGGTVAKEAGELLEIPQMLAQTLPGYGERGVHPGAELLAGAGRDLQRGGRALRGEREETRGVGLDPNVQSLDDMPEMQEFDRELQGILAEPATAPARLRKRASERALTSSRKRDEENL